MTLLFTTFSMLHSIVTLTLVIITNCPIVSTNQGPSGGRTHVSVRQDNMGACEQNPCENGGDCNILASESRVVDPEDMFVCHCMTGFYGKKCEQGSGISLNCTDTEMSVSVAHSLTMEESLVLSDGQCELRNETKYFSLQFQFSSCGTIQQIKSGKEVVYRQVINKKSEVGATNIISREGELAITRDSRFQITLFCSFDAKGVATAFFRSLQEVPLNASSFNTFQYALRLYRSQAYKECFNQSDYPIVVTIGEEIFFEAVLISQQPGLQVVARTCWASQTNSPIDPARYYLQRDGCATDPTFRRIPHPVDQYVDRFAFKAFQLVVDQTAVIYLHCEIYSCDAAASQKSICTIPDDCDEGYLGLKRQRRMIREQLEEESGGYERVVVSQGGALVFMRRQETPQDDLYGDSDHQSSSSLLGGTGDPEVTFVQLLTLSITVSLLVLMCCALCLCTALFTVFKLRIISWITDDD
ncbi:zona pellucida sperm-binding protein 4-like [Convolutriloba macropyga]|uniref:zona pellucida sperm-binding protein 4-like n=1 Tax=Convolutriloba macropyga TaxID=536237 RepID=UPI003F523BD1